MKKLLLLAALVPMMAGAQIRGTVLNDLMNKSNVSVADAAAAMVIAQAVGLDPMSVIKETRPYGVPVYDSGPAWWISNEYHRPVGDIYKMKASGMGWGEIAHKLGMHPGTFNKLRKQGAFDRYIWSDFTNSHGLPVADWNVYNNRGYAPRDIVVAYVVSDGNRTRVSKNLSSHKSSGHWNIPGRTPATSGNAKSKGNSKPALKGKSKSNTHGQGNDKVKGKGSGNGHGNKGGGVGNGKGKGGGGPAAGNGKGKGQGGGNGHGKGKGGGN